MVSRYLTAPSFTKQKGAHLLAPQLRHVDASKERFQHAPCGARFESSFGPKFPRFELDRLKLRELLLVIGSCR